MNNNYSIQLIWSDEDGCYLAQIQELPGCMSDGRTRQEALQNLEVILQEWIETATEEGMPVPAPLTLARLKNENMKAQEEFQKMVHVAITDALEKQKNESRMAQQTGWVRFDPNLELAFSGKSR